MRIPVIPTIVVAAAAAVMIALGVWQIQRADWKKQLIAQYEAAERLPPVAWPAVPPSDDKLLFRHAKGFCTEVTGWRTAAGRNRAAEPGWSHIASCRTGGMEGPGMQVDMGWSGSSDAPKGWRGGAVTGMIASDRQFRIRLISDQAAPGLQPSATPSPRDLPDNHLFYAVQWFFFAAAALVIYVLALRRRQARQSEGPETPDG